MNIDNALECSYILDFKSWPFQLDSIRPLVIALLRPFGYTNSQNCFLMQILLYGDKSFPDEINRDILLLTLKFIHKSGRFD